MASCNSGLYIVGLQQTNRSVRNMRPRAHFASSTLHFLRPFAADIGFSMLMHVQKNTRGQQGGRGVTKSDY